MLGHDSALALVRVEQVGVGPAAHHPPQLPAEVEPALEGGVHPGAAPWGDAVRGVPDEEGSAVTEALGQLTRGMELPDALDVRVEVGDAGPFTDRIPEPRPVERGEDPRRQRTAPVRTPSDRLDRPGGTARARPAW